MIDLCFIVVLGHRTRARKHGSEQWFRGDNMRESDVIGSTPAGTQRELLNAQPARSSRRDYRLLCDGVNLN